MKILVTGADGFLGAAVTHALLARGDAVIAFDTRISALRDAPATRLTSVVGDITDLAALARVMLEQRPDAVIHAAAIVGVLSSIGSPVQIVRVNVEGALNVFEAMRLAGVTRCIHISSEEAYGAFRTDPIEETHPLEPVLPYGICKATVEQLGRTYRDLHGLEVINLRTSWVYGAGLPRDRIPKNLLEAALAGRALHLASGADCAIDHTYVDDFVSGVLKALDHAVHRFDAYNIASGQATTVAQMIEIIRTLVPGAKLSVGPGPYRHGDRIESVKKGALDVSRAKAELGWAPRYDMRTGLAAYLQALKI
ncbi:MAG TPA: NAD-dependent epimerase/dehydratase family protein [Burkholderiales bacterium]|nr:NAD-dependent epimerase/dehydratase family protein [Burkholderiales bacterium]